MNFFDSPEITGTAASPQSSQPQQSLNDEVNQVIGQFGGFWRGFRKQSQAAIDTARKDLGDVVVQAQRELSKLTADVSPRTSTSTSREVRSSTELQSPPGSSTDQNAEESGETSASSPSTPHASDDPPTASGIQSILTRLQSSLPPNVVSTVQNSLPQALKHASGQSVDFGQLRTTLAAEFQRVQGVTRAQAEEYVQKSEGLLREAVKEAGDLLRDAVKVVPPEEAQPSSGAIWDGTDMWMFPSPFGLGSESTIGKGKGRDAGQIPGEAERAVATRAEALLKQLKTNPEIIRANPRDHDAIGEIYAEWIVQSIDARGGLDGEELSAKTSSALGDPVDGHALQATHELLVSSEMSGDEFWKRYLFRAHQIELEEKKRKALINSRVDDEEIFAWEDDEDENANSPTLTMKSPSGPSDPLASSQVTINPRAKSQAGETGDGITSSQTEAHSPRVSSEGSYDMMSSGNVSAAEKKADDKVEEVEAEEEEEEEEDDEDEDEGEDEEGGEDEEDEDEEEGSDWE